MARPPSNTSIIQSLILSDSCSAFVILLWAINKPAFNKIKARRQTVAEAYFTETHNYAVLSLSQGANSHTKNRLFWHCTFQIYCHKFHKTVVPLLTFTPDTFSHYSLSTNQAGFVFWFFPSRLVLVPDFFPSHWPTTIYERLSGLTNGKQFSACEKERMGPIKAETILQWQMKNHWALSALLWQSLMMTNWFINRTWFSTVSSTVNLIEIFSFAAELQHVSAGRVIFAPGGYYSWKKKENDSFKRRHQLVQ